MKFLATSLTILAFIFALCGVWWTTLPCVCAAIQAWSWNDGVLEAELAEDEQ